MKSHTFQNASWCRRNLRGCVENVLLVIQGAQSSGSDASDFTGDEGAAVKLFRLPPGRLHVSRHRYREFKAKGDTATEPPSGLQQVDSASVFLPDMSASTLNGWCRRTTGDVFSSAVLSTKSGRLLSSSDELQPRSLKVSWEAISPPGLIRKKTSELQAEQSGGSQVRPAPASAVLWSCQVVCGSM